MKKILLITLIAALTFSVSATEKEKKENTKTNNYDIVFVNGSINDINTGEALVGVEVQLEGTDQKTYTDFDGNFQFDNVKTGEYNILINYISYEKKTVENKKIELFSEPIKIKLEPVK